MLAAKFKSAPFRSAGLLILQILYVSTHSDVVGSWFNDEVEVSDVATSAGVPAGVDDGGWGWGDEGR